LLVAALSVGTLAVLMNRAVQFLTWPDPQWQVASCDVGQGDATVVRSENQIALIDTGKFDQKIDSCLSRLGVKRIELLVLTHFDLDHVAALHAAVQGRQVDLAMVTSFRDERPGADWVRQQLQLEQIPVVSAEAGMTGRLGAANWLVMNPPQAGDADDSNDGSIAMLFRLSGYNLIALADLGEHAQMRVAESMGQWFDSQFREQPLVMKVAHHGSADQYAEFIEALHPQVALISVGRNNGYGHPTARTLNLLGRVGALLARTDLLGSITLGATASSIAVAGGG
jgi:competence protein ComEC